MTDVHTDAPETSSLEAALDAFLEGAAEELDGPPANVKQAASLAAALAVVRRRRGEALVLLTDRIEALRRWHAEVDGPLERREEELEGLLSGWALATWEDSGRKTITLPTGKVAVRTRKPRLDMDHSLPTDTATRFVAAVDQRYVRVTESIAVSDVKADAVPGKVLPDYPEYLVPEGYQACEVLVPHADGDRKAPGSDVLIPHAVVPGVVMFTPLEGRAGQTVKVTT